jgi:hypothetical protein
MAHLVFLPSAHSDSNEMKGGTHNGSNTSITLNRHPGGQ